MNQEIRDYSQKLLGAETFSELSEKKYERRLNRLRADLMKAQHKLRDAPNPVIIIIAGVDGAGKGRVIQLLNEWLDPRDLSTHSFWNLSNEALQRPRYWRYWNALPRRGKLALWFGGWYSALLMDSVYQQHSNAQLEENLKDIQYQESALIADGAVILKFWFHLTKAEQEERLRHLYEKPKEHWRAMSDDWQRHDLYQRVASISATILSKTHGDRQPWFIVPSANLLERNLILAALLSRTLENLVNEASKCRERKARTKNRYYPASRCALAEVDLTQWLSREDYNAQLVEAQSRLHRLFWAAYKKKISTVLVFEGWDAAGKGGAIRRVTAAIDTRLFRIVQVGPPTLEEHAYHYLWRFWRDLPRDGRVTIFDRSWYGRVLVERIEGFATDAEWQRAYAEINEFEKEIARHGTVLVKFWIHISKEKQLSRFHSREQTAHKRHKITEEDWRNREHWEDYKAAVNDMVAYTTSPAAPWKLIAGNNKRFARIQTIQTVCERLESALK